MRKIVVWLVVAVTAVVVLSSVLGPVIAVIKWALIVIWLFALVALVVAAGNDDG